MFDSIVKKNRRRPVFFQLNAHFAEAYVVAFQGIVFDDLRVWNKKGDINTSSQRPSIIYKIRSRIPLPTSFTLLVTMISINPKRNNKKKHAVFQHIMQFGEGETCSPVSFCCWNRFIKPSFFSGTGFIGLEEIGEASLSLDSSNCLDSSSSTDLLFRMSCIKLLFFIYGISLCGYIYIYYT